MKLGGMWPGIAVASLLGLLAFANLGMQDPGGEPRERPRRERPDRAAGGERRGMSVEGAMNAMNRSAEILKDQIADASKKDENLRLISDMQRACIAAKGAQLDEALAKIENEDEKKAMALKFRITQIELAHTLLNVESNLLADNADAAKTEFDKAMSIRERAHKELGVE